MDDFHNKVVFITGASSGIGARTAIDFARTGAKLALTGRNGDKLQKTVDQCIEAGQTAENIFTTTGDLTIQEDVNKFIDGAIDKFGTINVLVNNAGIAVSGGLRSIDVELFDASYNMNLRSVFMVTSRALPKLIEAKGNIVNVSSLAGLRPTEYMAAYSIMKAALNQFTTCLANEVGPLGVRVNAVNPSVTKTNFFTADHGMFSNTPEKVEGFYQAMGMAHPLRRVAEDGDVSQAIRFLASDAASFINGVLMPLCGGRINTMQGPMAAGPPKPPQAQAK